MSRTWTGPVSGSVSYTHDDFFRIGSRAVNGGTALNLLYDADGFFLGTSGLAGFTVTRDYQNENGLVTGTTLGGLSDVYTYNGFGEPKTYAATFAGSTIYSLQVDSRDALGRITGLTDAVAGASHAWAFEYDAHGDLSSATEDGNATSYTYDPNGNRLSVAGAASTYDAQDRLLSSPSVTYTYTNNGDLATEVTSSGTASFTYDLQSSLRSVTLPSGDTVKYVIDGERHRIQRTWTHGGQTVVQGFLYDDSLRIAAELDGSGKVVSTFGYGLKGNVPDVLVRGGNTYRLVTDWRGSVRAVVEANAGTVVETIDYDAWGNAAINDTTCASGAVCAMFQPFGFAGGLFDRETGLVRFGARDYDPSVGRWTQKDPISFAGGQQNIYVYVNDDPINGSDPSGLDAGQCSYTPDDCSRSPGGCPPAPPPKRQCEIDCVPRAFAAQKECLEKGGSQQDCEDDAVHYYQFCVITTCPHAN